MPLTVSSCRNFVVWITIVVFSFCVLPYALADVASASVSIAITDTSGALVPDASVVITNLDSTQEQRARSGRTGLITFAFLKPGRYKIVVEKQAFAEVTVSNLVLHVGDVRALQLILKVGPASQSVTVDGSGLSLNTTDASVSTVIDRNFVANMPLNGRSFQDLLTLSPGVSQIPVNLFGGTVGGVGYSGEIVVNGQRTESNYFTVDGVSANTGVSAGSYGGGAGYAGGVAGETALGSTQSLASIDALQEFRATTSTYSAEYGRTPGGQFAFATRSGGDTFHGTAYDYLRNDALDASNWFNNYLSKPKGKERQNDFGGTLGGPMLIPHVYNGKQRTFFFFSYEGLRLDSPQAATQVAVPSVGLRQQAPTALQPVLNAFPIPNANSDGLNDGLSYYIETVSYPARLDSTSARIDHNISEKWKVFGRYAYTPSNNTSYAGAIANSTTGSLGSVTLGSTNVFTQRQNNDFRFNFTRNSTATVGTSTNLGGAVPFNPMTLPGLASSSSEVAVIFTYGPEASFLLRTAPATQDQMNLTDTYNLNIGKHDLRFGIDWRRVETTANTSSPLEGFYFESPTQIPTNAPGFAIAEAFPQIKPVYTNFSAFAQDEWKVSPKLSLSLGLRWDVNPPPGSAGGPTPYTLNEVSDISTAQLAPAGTPLWNTDWHGFAPRLGMAYQANQHPGHGTVLRVGYGVFYDTGNLLGSQGFGGIGIASSATVTGASFPLTASQLQVPPASAAKPYSTTVFAFNPALTLPYSMQYNVALEQQLSDRQSFTVSYVGSSGRKLLSEFGYYPGQLGNTNFSTSGFAEVTGNLASSSYNSLQAKYQHTLAAGFQGLISYTWSHSIDDASANTLLDKLQRASSDFDIRHQLQAAITYEVPALHTQAALASIVGHWGADLRLQARSSLPLDIGAPATVVPSTGEQFEYQPNFVSGQPTYLYGSQYPGKRILNYKAFVAAPAGVQGDVPRNYARQFDAVQTDIALRRTFPIRKQTNIQFRAEAFNLFNHPQFGSIYNLLSYGPTEFGYAYNTLNGQLGGLNPLYQIGGPRSLQMMLRIAF
ncbi:TonB-dependent receptor [Acidicapsa ligni]|uniref:TonB-dependent receptor n=1 Tax=Acidicapsa ligni TaxID=542300 RepID=UPI0021DF4D73|nr:TonB-dependent receptor [Acidicapsa ligni]